nr:short-chain dehydrogenase TIC 32, chloroplastic-like isoform X2 [Tanacetum cinerariifolium]
FESLGHFLLTQLLVETMKRTSHEQNIEGRIVNVSSEAHRFAYKGMYFDQLNNESSYNSIYAYGQSKLANILHAKELTRHFKENGVNITANALHPGSIATNLLRYHSIIDGVVDWVGKYFLKNIPQGAATTCYVALHPQVKGVSGEYFMDNNIAQPNSYAKDAKLAKELWDISLTMVAP